MLYDVKTPSEYLYLINNDWRKEKLLEVRAMILKNGTNLEEGIQYKMLSYGYDDRTVFHLNAQRAYVSLYVGDIGKVENARELLKDFNLGKGCIRITKSIRLSKSNLEAFIIKTLEIWEGGGNTDC